MIKAGTEASRRCSLSSLLIIGGREVLMHKVDECIEILHRTTLPEFLNKEDTRQKISKLLKRNIISQEQYDDVLYPCTGTVSSGQLEIALLVVLWRTCFSSVPYDDQLWYKGVEPALNDDSIEADIVRLRDFKNELQSTPNHSEDAFENKWSCISRILLRMGEGLQSLCTTLDILKEKQHSPDEYDRMQAELQRWTDMDQEYECGLDLAPSKSKSRSYRLYLLITDGCCRVIRHLFDNKIPPPDLQRTIDDNIETLQDLKRKKVIKETQYKLLFPSTGGSPSSEDFDISLLIILLINICGYSSAMLATDAPTESDITPEADIAQLRHHRNKISHRSRTGGLSETDFENMWTDINQILLRLDGACAQPLPNLQSEIDNLKKETFDPKREQDREDVVNTWIEMESKIIGAIKKHSASEAAKARCKETVKDVLSNDYFVKTKQFTEAMDRLKKNNIIVLNGAPGEGKTTIAKKLLLEVSANDRYMQLNTYSDWDYVNLDTVDGVLIDDMFGSGVFDKEECRKWQKHIPFIATVAKSKDLYVIITSRSYILADALEKMIAKSVFVKENIVTLSSKNLTEVEKTSILKNHFSKASHKVDTHSTEHRQLVENIVKLVLDSTVSSSTIGFPECARLISGNRTLYKEGVAFFKSPMTAVKTCVSNLLNDDDDTFVAFFVLWAQTLKSLTSIDLECPVENTHDNIIKPIKSLQYRPIDHIRQIRGVLQSHRGGFIHFHSESEIFSFSHRVLQDAVGLVIYEKNTTAVMQYCDPSFIENYISIDKSEQSRIEKHRDDKRHTSVTETSSHDITEAEAISDGSGSEVSVHGSIRPKASTLLGSENQLNVLGGSRSESSEHESSVRTKQLDPNKDELSEHSRTVPDIDEYKEASGEDYSSSTDKSNDDTILGETSVLGLDTPMNMIQLNPARYKQLSVRIGTLVTSDLQPHDSHKNLDVSLLKLKLFENEDFCETFFVAMREKDMLEQILQTPIQTLESEFAEFKFFKNVKSEIRLPSYMLWNNERLCPLIEKGFAAMDGDLLKHELNIAMLIATKLGNCKLVGFLLGKGAAIDINMIAIALAKQNNEMFDFLMNTRKWLAETTVLHEVCKAGYTEIASLLLKKGFSTTERDEYGHCPVHVAAIRGHFDTICALLEFDSSQANIPYTSVKPNHNAIKEATLFHIAAYMEHDDLVNVLIDHGIHANVPDANGRTPFMLAIYAKRYVLVPRLLQLAVEDGVQSTPDKDNNTPLLIAIKNIATLGRRYLPTVIELCKYKQNIHLENSEGDIALYVACKRCLDEIARAILDQDNPFKREGDNTVLNIFTRNNNRNSIETLLRCGITDNISVQLYKILFRLEKDPKCYRKKSRPVVMAIG